MQELPLYKKLFSYILPVRVWKGKSEENPHLELLFYRGQYQLATFDALYSDGNRYKPLKKGFAAIKDKLGSIDTVLVLGTGLGSAVDVMEHMHAAPRFTLVEHDKTVLKLAMEKHSAIANRLKPVCTDAQLFMAENTERFDLVVVDVFNGRTVPRFVTTEKFMQQCRSSMNDGGCLVFNYIIEQPKEWQRVDALMRNMFNHCSCIDDGLNRIIIATA